MIALDRFISNKYLVMTTSTIVTKISPLMAKTVQLWKMCGSTNRRIGRVILEAKNHVKMIFQVFILSFLKKSLHKKNKIIVSKIIVISSDFRKDRKYIWLYKINQFNN
jgi:hypothetical protein